MNIGTQVVSFGADPRPGRVSRIRNAMDPKCYAAASLGILIREFRRLCRADECASMVKPHTGG